MSGARSRRSAAPARADTNPSESPQQNGHPKTETIVTEKENIFLFAPNLIGYARIVLAVVSLWYMPLHPR